MNKRNTVSSRRWTARLAVLALLTPLALSAQADGPALYQQHCAACHGAAGAGVEGLAPPLQNPALWQRLGGRGPEYIAQVLAGGLTGTLTVNGVVYRAVAMPPQAHIPASDLVQVAGYVMGTLNGAAAVPNEAQITAARSAPVAHAELRQWRSGAAR